MFSGSIQVRVLNNVALSELNDTTFARASCLALSEFKLAVGAQVLVVSRLGTSAPAALVLLLADIKQIVGPSCLMVSLQTTFPRCTFMTTADASVSWSRHWTRSSVWRTGVDGVGVVGTRCHVRRVESASGLVWHGQCMPSKSKSTRCVRASSELATCS